MSTSTDSDPQALLAAVRQARRRGKAAAARSCQEASSALEQAPVTPKRRRRRKVVASSSGVIRLPQSPPETRQSSDFWQQREGLARVCHLSAWGACALAALLVVAVLSASGWWRAPVPAPLAGIYIDGGNEVPAELKRRWLRSFHGVTALRQDPNHATLDALAIHLAQQPEVARVGRIGLEWRRHEGQLRRMVVAGVRMREPLMPVMLASGERAWVDGDGVLLPGILSGPSGQPVLRNLEQGGLEALHEALAAWPLVAAQLPHGLITAIDLDHPFHARLQQRGIVFLTRYGNRLEWGRPGDERFGLDPARKARHLAHTLACQGDLSQVPVVSVRFDEPHFVLAR